MRPRSRPRSRLVAIGAGGGEGRKGFTSSHRIVSHRIASYRVAA
jgi:hypothetical protein